MTWGAVAVGVIGAGAGIYSANKSADAMADANSGDLPDWLKPYMTGGGGTPSYIDQDPLINSNWMDYVNQLGQGQWDAPWQPMTDQSLQFHPERQFTPVDDGSPYGSLPEQPPVAEQPIAPPVQQQPDNSYWARMGENPDNWHTNPMGGMYNLTDWY